MNVSKFSYTRDFQCGILGLMVQNYEFLMMASELVKPDYFEDKVLIFFFTTIRDYYLDYKTTPTLMVLRNQTKKGVDSKKIKVDEFDIYLDTLSKIEEPVDAAKYVIDEVVRFCRRQACRRAFLESTPLMDSATDDIWDGIVDKVMNAAKVGNNFLDVGTFYFKDIQERIQNRITGNTGIIIPTGILELDYKLNGGLKAGQLGIWMGGTGVGKSVALPHVGKAAIIHNYKVAHYTLELSALDIAARYDANWTRTNINELRQNSSKVQQDLTDLYAKYGDSLVIKEYPTGTATVSTIHTHIKQLHSMGFRPDMVIVDYGDLLKPTTNYKDAYDDLGAIFVSLRGLAGELQVPVWTATQVNRPGLNAELPDIENMSDSLKKAMIADVIVAICATREELENKVLRLFGAKNRNGPSKFVVEIRSNYEQMVFYDPTAGAVSVGKTPDPVVVAQPEPEEEIVSDTTERTGPVVRRTVSFPVADGPPISGRRKPKIVALEDSE